MTIKIIPNKDTLPVKLDSDGRLVKTDGTVLDVSSQIDLDTIGLTSKADKTNPVFVGSITEQVNVCDLSLDATNGTIQTYTATADFTFTDSLLEGQSLLLRLSTGGFTPTYPEGMVWVGGTEPMYTTTDDILFYKIGTTLSAAYVGSVEA